MDNKEQVAVSVIVQQRNNALDTIAGLQAEVFERDQKIKELESKLNTPEDDAKVPIKKITK